MVECTRFLFIFKFYSISLWENVLLVLLVSVICFQVLYCICLNISIISSEW